MKMNLLLRLLFMLSATASANDQVRVIELREEVRLIELTVKNFEFSKTTQFYKGGTDGRLSVTVVRPEVLIDNTPHQFFNNQGASFCEFLKNNVFTEIDGTVVGSPTELWNPRSTRVLSLSNGATNPTVISSIYTIYSITCR